MKKKIIYAVVAIHLALLLFAAASLKNKLPHHSVPIAVTTYVASKPAPKKTKNKQIVSKAKPKPPPQKPVRKKARDVMSDLQKNIAKIETKRDNKQQGKPKAENKAQRSVEKPMPKSATQYPLLLVQKLKNSLHLPEEGDVKLKLTLKNSGEVIHVKVLSSLSKDNAIYLQEEIPKMRFPGFTADLIGKKEHTFTLTFRHDD